MNEVSIILNGTRYDAVDYEPSNEVSCCHCDLVKACNNLRDESGVEYFGSFCYELIGNKTFKKSDKKFEP